MTPSQDLDPALLEIIWNLETCEEAVEVFDGEFEDCPVCGERINENGEILHHKRIH